MITLRVREKGHLIEIPGVAPFRTPADIDVSRIEIRKVIGHLKVCGITDYQIVAVDKKGNKETYNQEDFTPKKKKKKKAVVDPYKKQIESRFDKLEKMIMSLLTREKKGNEDLNKEQITEKLEQLERISKEILSKRPDVIYKDSKGRKKVKEEERFIPSIDIKDLKLKSSSVKSLKQDQKEDIDNAADSLSELLGGKK